MRSYTVYFVLLVIFFWNALSLWIEGESIFMIGIAIISLLGLILKKFLTENSKKKE